jgi:hypothetical protein
MPNKLLTFSPSDNNVNIETTADNEYKSNIKRETKKD